LLAGGGTAMAADNSMPGNPLYPVKLATEQVRLALTRSDIGKAELYATLADRRIVEIAYMVNKGRLKHVEITVQRLNKHLNKITGLPLAGRAEMAALTAPAKAPLLREKTAMDEAAVAGEGVHPLTNAQAAKRGRLKLLLGRHAVNHPAKLRALLERVPESAKPALQEAIAVSVATYKQALEDLD